MISIDGLNDRQHMLADLIWSCGTLDELQELIDSLPTLRDKQDCHSLVSIIRDNAIEFDHRDQHAWDNAMDDAKEICKQFML